MITVPQNTAGQLKEQVKSDLTILTCKFPRHFKGEREFEKQYKQYESTFV